MYLLLVGLLVGTRDKRLLLFKITFGRCIILLNSGSMKKFKKIITGIFVLTCLLSCNIDEKDSDIVRVNETTLCARWMVVGSSDFESFEFNENGHYIVVKDTSVESSGERVTFGTYEILDDNSIQLFDFGTLAVSGISETSIRFSIRPLSNLDSVVVINASKHDELERSINTDLLCRSWEVISFGDEAMSNMYIIFSRTGSYLVNAVVEGKEITRLGVWSWCNADQNKLAFTIDNVLDCDGVDIIKEIQLTSSMFFGIDMENIDPKELIMQPAFYVKPELLVSNKAGVTIMGVENQLNDWNDVNR